MSTQAESPKLFGAALRAHVARDPEALALRMPDGDRSFRHLLTNAERIAGRLQAAGCVPGDRIAILSTVSVDALEIMIGSVLARTATVPLSTSLQPSALAGLITDCGPRLLFVLPAFLNDARIAAPDVETIVLSDRRVESAPELPTFQEWLSADGSAYRAVEEHPDDLFSIIYSSGTTGTPKGIAHSNGVRSGFYHLLSRMGAGPGSRMLVTTALYTNATFSNLISIVYNGGAAVGAVKFSPEAFLAQVRDDAITNCFLVPLQVRRILDSPAFDPACLRSLAVTTVSGSVFDLETKQRIIATWPGEVIELYGMTEGGANAAHSLKTQRAEKLGSVGTPSPGSEIVIVGDDGKLQPADQPGEIAGWSALMMMGYFNRRDLTAAIEWQAPDGRLFLKTGDIGSIDDEGYLYVTDRKKDMIISGGMNIYASDIEAIFLGREDVAEVAVIAVPSDRWGETPYALVVAAEGARIDEAELLNWANGRLGKTSRLSGLELREGLTRNQMGKVVKRELREPFWQDQKLRVG